MEEGILSLEMAGDGILKINTPTFSDDIKEVVFNDKRYPVSQMDKLTLVIAVGNVIYFDIVFISGPNKLIKTPFISHDIRELIVNEKDYEINGKRVKAIELYAEKGASVYLGIDYLPGPII
jgi:hypothetical protein